MAHELGLPVVLGQGGQVGHPQTQLLGDVVGDEDLVAELHPGAVLVAVGDQLGGIVLQELEDARVGGDDRLPAVLLSGGDVGALVGVDTPGAGPQGGHAVQAGGVGVAVEEHDVGADELLGGAVRGDGQVHGDVVGVGRDVGAGGEGRTGTDQTSRDFSGSQGQMSVINTLVLVCRGQFWQG